MRRVCVWACVRKRRRGLCVWAWLECVCGCECVGVVEEP